MNKAFKNWCSESVENKIIDIDIFQIIIKDLFPLLNYDQRNISKKDVNLSFDYSLNALIFKNSKSFELDREDGQCQELAEKTLELLKIRFPEFASRYEVVIGQEPIYFSQYSSQHYFLAEKNNDIEESRRNIIDPSFRKIGAADELGYFIYGKCKTNNDLVLLENHLTPYSFLENNLLMLGWTRNTELSEKIKMILALNYAFDRITLISFESFIEICKILRLNEIQSEIIYLKERIDNLLN